MPFAQRVVKVTANYTALPTDDVILVDATAGAATITLPQTGMIASKHCVVKIDASANAVTVRYASGNINGAGTTSLAAQYNKVTTVDDGVNAFIVA